MPKITAKEVFFIGSENGFLLAVLIKTGIDISPEGILQQFCNNESLKYACKMFLPPVLYSVGLVSAVALVYSMTVNWLSWLCGFIFGFLLVWLFLQT